ncbi:Do family serine endopeptidase [Permianibacter fluminis]|uniref:Do family serine endopeptidase n=1 Tax=Permianibacter fluminis TaxID=2738515 RepID=UPI002E2B2C62|nr:Do family serine endopeptidase [Permianibacter fluminis]
MVTSISTDIKASGRTRGGPSGSGFIISTDGYVLTNHHVVAEAETIKVHLKDGRVFTAKKVGEDEDADVALLKIEASNLKAAKIGSLDALKPGAWVLAFGAPFGLEHSVSAGIVSGKGRSLRWNQYVPFIQSDVAINSGNSGGPLVNINGEVVGINSQILSSNGGSIGLSFSIPIDLAMDVAQQLKAGGKVARGYIGVGIQDVSDEIAASFGLDRPRGALIGSVEKGGPADKAGLKAGDVITGVDGQKIEDSGELPFLIGAVKPGKSAKIELLRDGKVKTLSVTVGAKKADDEVASSDSTGNKQRRLGVVVGELTDEQRVDAAADGGILVRDVEDGPAADAGIRPGDIILSINRQPVSSVSQFRELVSKLPAGKSVPVHVVTRGNARFLVLRVPE